MRNLSLLLGAVLLVQGVFGVDEVKTVSVMVGDSLTLNTDFTETKGDELQWRIEGESDVLAQIDREAKKISEPGNNDERFRGRLKLDHQTGSLTIMNIRSSDSGVYELKIKDSRNENKCRFIVTVRGGVKTVSVKEGEPVNLHTSVVEIKGFDQILWKTKGDLVAEINRVTNMFLLNDDGDVRFNGRLDLDRQTGDLTISDSEMTDTGVYHLHMISSSHTVKRTISVTVKDSRSSGSVSGISGASVVLMVWAVTVFLLQEV